MAEVGDRVKVVSPKVGQAVREGVVTGVSGSLLRIRWATGEESTLVPAAGSLIVTGKGTPLRPGPAKKVTTTQKTRKAPQQTTATTATKVVNTKAVTVKKAADLPGSHSEVPATKPSATGTGPVTGAATRAAKKVRGRK
jgi:hypothetical protein